MTTSECFPGKLVTFTAGNETMFGTVTEVFTALNGKSYARINAGGKLWKRLVSSLT